MKQSRPQLLEKTLPSADAPASTGVRSIPAGNGQQLLPPVKSMTMIERNSRPRPVCNRLPLGALSLLFAASVAACGGGGATGGSSGSGTIGQSHTNADGTVWFTEENQGGAATQLFIEEVFWGRLVNVYDAQGTLMHRDYLIGEDIRSDGLDYQLDINAVTEQANLTILHDAGTVAYESAFDRIDQNLGPILPKGVEGDLPPFSFVPRNAAIEVRFSDVIDPATLNATTLQVQVGNPPSDPFEARLTIDPNYGAEIGGVFYPTRALIDTTVSELEAGGTLLPLNSLGLPASKTTTLPNVGLRIPTQLDFSSGQFQVLSNPSGHSLSNSGNGPVDFSSSTVDVVRGMRSGGDSLTTGDLNNGFLLDLNPPRLVGSQPVSLLSVVPDVGGGPDDYVVSFQFASLPCASALAAGDVLQLPGVFAEATLPSSPPDTGLISDARVRLLSGDPIDFHPGTAQVLSTFDKAAGDQSNCFMSFSPLPGAMPNGEVSPDAQVVLRFSEPMDPASLQPFDTFTVTNSPSSFGITNFIVGEVLPSSDLKEFRFVPNLPLAHTLDTAESYYVNVTSDGGGATDLAGNALAEFPDQVQFSLKAGAASERNGGLVLRFNQPNEDGDFSGNIPLNEYAGQFLLDADRGLIKARPVERSAAIGDPTQAVPAVMITVTTGVQTPLSPLGSRMMDIYRHFDVGYSLTDPSTYNMDIEGINWAPLQGQVQADYFAEFEVNLAHSKRLPDEHRNTALLPTKPSSGLLTSAFVDNVLEDPINGLVTVHPKPLGYLIDPVDIFVGGSGTKFIPYPVNRNLPEDQWAFYTWRDTSLLAQGGDLSNGVPTFIELDVGLISGDTNVYGQTPGEIASPGNVPSIGLPLLMEFKCYPSDDGVGLNSLACAIAINSSPKPTFRIFSTGGYDTAGNPVIKNPDTEVAPTGGFNANPALPQALGSPTSKQDNVFYYGQLDVVVRVSRTYTRWLNTDEDLPDYLTPVLEPRPDDQPTDTSLEVHYRGATKVNATPNKEDDPQLNADALTVYGDQIPATGSQIYGAPSTMNPGITFKDQVNTWSDSIDSIDGAKFLQARFTFIGNTISGLTPELSAFGVAFLRNS